MRKTVSAAIVAALVAAALVGAQAATATSPGTNGKLAFVRGGNVWTMNADGSAQTQVTTGGGPSSPTWRPDAQKIAYVDYVSGELKIVNPDGTGAQTLLADPGVLPLGLSWSPDCTKLAYGHFDSVPESTEHIWVVNVATGATTQLTSGVTLDRAPDWSPNGAKIAFTSTRHVNDPNGLPANGSTNHLLYVMQADGTGVTRLTTLTDPTGSLHERNPSWKPDGSAIAIRSDTDFGEFPTGGPVVVVSSDGSTRTTLTTADDQPLSGIDPVWSPDGTKLMVPGLVLYDVTTRATTALSSGDSEPAWAPATGSCGAPSDTVAPVLSVPAPIVLDATAPGGATVTYSATATDAVDPAPTVKCTPPSGSSFSIGDTTVSCTATDNSGNAAPATFTVHVRGAAEQLARLQQRITTDATIFPLAKAALAAGIRALSQGLNTTRASQIRTCIGLDVFAAAVRGLPPPFISSAATRAGLVADAQRIRAVLAC